MHAGVFAVYGDDNDCLRDVEVQVGTCLKQMT